MGKTKYTGGMGLGGVKQTSNTATRVFGDVVQMQSKAFTYTDTGSFTTSIMLPANSQIIEISAVMSAAFDSGTSDAMEIGTSADADAYGDIADLQATGKLTAAFDATQAALVDNIGSSNVEVYATINSAGGGLSAGAGNLMVVYAIK